MAESLSSLFGPVSRAIAWALLHFVWQGALIAGLLALANRVLRQSTSDARYNAACGALVVALLLPTATFNALRQKESATQGLIAQSNSPEVHANTTASAATTKHLPQNRIPDSPVAGAWRTHVEIILPWLFSGWLLGVVLLSARLMGGWVFAQHLRNRFVKPVSTQLRARLQELASRLGVLRPVWMFESSAAETPMVIGWLRPVILLPASTLTGLTPSQLESIIAHELAHIRRHDYLINLIQSFAETLLFYHPAVWWISHRIREERENCCDDLALTVCGDEIVYAEALTRLEEQRAASHQLALAATGGSLFARIQRVLAGAESQVVRPGRAAAGATIIVLVALTSFQAGFLTALLTFNRVTPKPHVSTPGSTVHSTNSFQPASPLASALAQTKSFAWNNARLIDVIDELARGLNAPLHLPDGLTEERITCAFDEATLEETLNGVLARKRLGWQFDGRSEISIYNWQYAETNRRWHASKPPTDRQFYEAGFVSIDLHCSSEPLEKVCAIIGRQIGVRFTVPENLRATRVSYDVHNRMAREVLAEVLEPLHLDYRVLSPATIEIRSK